VLCLRRRISWPAERYSASAVTLLKKHIFAALCASRCGAGVALIVERIAMAEAFEAPPVSPADYAERNAPPHGDGAASGAQRMFGDAAEALKHRAREVAEEQKKVGADRIDALGRAIHGAADELGKEIPGAADYIHMAANNIESASSALRERSVDEFIGGFSRFARRQPAAAFAGAVIAGFALSRFLKSSNR
jgi:hypothetical protein